MWTASTGSKSTKDNASDFEKCVRRFRILLDDLFRPLMDGLATDQAEQEGRPVVGRF